MTEKMFNKRVEHYKRKKSLSVKSIVFILLMISLLLLIITPKASAIGMSPAATTLDFTTEEKTYSFSIINSENKEFEIVIYVQGELAKYITLSHTSDRFRTDEESKEYQFSLKLPNNLDPGTRIGEIVVMEVPSSSEKTGTNLNARIALVHQVHVNVPYPVSYTHLTLPTN